MNEGISARAFSGKGVPPPPTPARRSALHPADFSLDPQRKVSKRNGPRRPARDFVPEADPTPASAALPPQVSRALRAAGPQRPTGRIGQGQPRYRHKIVLETPQWGIERLNQIKIQKRLSRYLEVFKKWLLPVFVAVLWFGSSMGLSAAEPLPLTAEPAAAVAAEPPDFLKPESPPSFTKIITPRPVSRR